MIHDKLRKISTITDLGDSLSGIHSRFKGNAVPSAPGEGSSSEGVLQRSFTDRCGTSEGVSQDFRDVVSNSASSTYSPTILLQ